MFEIDGVEDVIAREARRLAAMKLLVKTTYRDPGRMVNCPACAVVGFL